jgi:uncharacterized protein YndB with AHSA1/START domain
MSANVMVMTERQFDHPRPVAFRAWAEPGELSQWRGRSGWHVEAGTASADNRLAGWQGEGWEKELTRLHDFVEAHCGGTR